MPVKEFIYPVHMEICVTAEDIRVRQVKEDTEILMFTIKVQLLFIISYKQDLSCFAASATTSHSLKILLQLPR